MQHMSSIRQSFNKNHHSLVRFEWNLQLQLQLHTDYINLLSFMRWKMIVYDTSRSDISQNDVINLWILYLLSRVVKSGTICA